ncbi:hypothetical protein [Halalkalibacter nanhaiisediminis]|uniref:Uncharacterized protein n=1 Tax=Halalkalibacter nanhaiisediminis TaxID=688079 RepID=A0A562QUN8_9BACI|nr:hypothetical protein [Halalkalibacter nanhaiisediminis]TWI59846.1 hypothetical protein IQ10_00268 [Halalkalibacter nanhaiisediminis]
MNTDYQSFLAGMFICGELAVPTVVTKEDVKLVVDLRAEASEGVVGDQVDRVHVPLVNGEPNQSQLLSEAIGHVVNAYQEGKRVVLH